MLDNFLSQDPFGVSDTRNSFNAKGQGNKAIIPPPVYLKVTHITRTWGSVDHILKSQTQCKGLIS